MSPSSKATAQRRVKLLESVFQVSKENTAAKDIMHLCAFNDIPPVEGQPAGCAWNYYVEDKSKRDQLGRMLGLLLLRCTCESAYAATY